MEDISIAVYHPLVTSGLFIKDIKDKISSYTHQIQTIGGYWSASMSINDNQQKVEDWIENGLGRHIEVYNPELDVIWEGFVNQIQANLGPLSFTVGPLLDIGNKVKVDYTPIDTATDPPSRGTETFTDFGEDTDSQAKYGIIEKIISGNSAKDLSDAEDIRTKFLNDPEGPWPATSRDSNLSGGSGPTVTLNCLGYWHWLTTYYPVDANTGTRTRSTKIQDVLGAELNSIFSTDYSKVATNADTIQRQETGKRTAQTILLEVNKTGISNNRANIGFYAGRQLTYEEAPTTIEYIQRVGDNRGITDGVKNIVRPWDVLPGKWIFYSDFLVGKIYPTTLAELQQDLRAGYIESASFTAPYSGSINGVKFDEIGLFLEKLNLRNGGD